MIINSLIIDDEQLARDILESYAQRIPDLNIIGKCKNIAETKSFLRENKIDLLFLDINMPGINGIDFIRSLKSRPSVIFITAYSSYAVDGFELAALDYILKPISFERFHKSVTKYINAQNINNKAKAYDLKLNPIQGSVVLKEGYNFHNVLLKDIMYVQSMKEYVFYHSKRKRIMVHSNMQQVSELLPQDFFIRIHRSYFVSKLAVDRHVKNKIILNNGTELPIGKKYKTEALEQIFQ